ncbi:MAG: type III secretion inner membrane ring lipoprotein SctJ [Chlamydiales bacterium]
MRVISRFLFVLVIFLTIFTGCTTQTTIVNNISEREANEIVVLMASKGIHAEKIETTLGAGQTGVITYNVSVSSSQITEALAILNSAGLPRVKGTSLLDLFGNQGLVPSDLQDRIRYQEGLSEQLATTIRKIDGIIDANVQITFPRDEETNQEMTASVYIKHRSILDNPNSLTITKIKRLVASAVPGLTSENVTVISDRALYADITLKPMYEIQEDRDYMSIWSIIIAKESIPRFRLIFYLFIIALFLLLTSLAWLVWKFWDIIQKKGGLSSLFYPHQYEIHDLIKHKEKEKGAGGDH